VTLTEPLLSPDRRQRVETALADLAATRPRWLAYWAAGVLADIAGTLPRYDPWTRLSGRLGRITVGPEPPETDGACHAGGQPYGTWTDGADLVALVFERPEVDAAFAALADPLDTTAAGLVAFAGNGPSWRHVLPTVAEAWRVTTRVDLPDGDTATRCQWPSFGPRWWPAKSPHPWVQFWVVCCGGGASLLVSVRPRFRPLLFWRGVFSATPARRRR
jgi:hypothetical protein